MQGPRSKTICWANWKKSVRNILISNKLEIKIRKQLMTKEPALDFEDNWALKDIPGLLYEKLQIYDIIWCGPLAGWLQSKNRHLYAKKECGYPESFHQKQ